MRFAWPAGFERIPDEEWTRGSVDSLAAKYDRVDNHGWYANLDPTVTDLREHLQDGMTLVDYSGGTGILIGRLFEEAPGLAVGVVNVDSSPKFLRLSLEKFREDERVAFRLIRYLKEEKRLELVTEVLGPLAAAQVDALASTNAIHLYYDLDDTLAAWAAALKPGGHAFVQSGNVANPRSPAGAWIIDDTVHAIGEAASEIVREDAKFAKYRSVLGDKARMAKFDDLRQKFFLPPRPAAHYRDALERAGLRVLREEARAFRAKTFEWYQFLAVYHEGVLGWVGGSERIDGRAPTDDAVRDRLALMRAALDRVLRGREDFEAVWTYWTCVRA